MSRCKWRDKPGSEELCQVLTSAGRELCPRHEFMDKVRQEKEEAKHREAVLKKKVITPMPKTRRELIAFGYQLRGSGDCSSCGKHIEWWRTPNGNNAPYDPTSDVESAAVSHFATCTRAASFRRSA